ncbi:MAG: hypothetical protein WC312_03755 [Candidatus Omnitrophota bacterium]|jgi:hypothetical protein
MGVISAIKRFFQGIFDKIGALIGRLLELAKPFLKETLSKTAQDVWASTQDLFMEAVKYVAEKGFPDDEAKRKAFKEYMEGRAKYEIKQLKDSEFNLLREMALAIWKVAMQKQ